MVSPCHYDLLHCYGLGVGVAAGRALATPSTLCHLFASAARFAVATPAHVSPHPHVDPLFRAWPFSSAREPAIPSLGNTAHVRNSGLTCATGDPHARQLVDTQDMLEPTSLSHADDRSQTMGHPHTPKVQTASPKNGKNGLFWVRWSAIWANPGTRQTRPPTTPNFPAPHSRKVTTPATQCVHPSSCLPPPSTPAFPHQQAEKSPQNQHVVPYNPCAL